MTRIFCILCLVALMSCDKDENSGKRSYNITISGIVTDQLTGQPVEGATVSCGVQRGAMPGNSLVSVSVTTLSGSDGMYSLTSRTESVKDIISVPIGQRGLSIAVIAKKDGFEPSNRAEIYYYNAENQVINFTLNRTGSN